jgi:DNA-binding transcriptional regulator GbsR (MarR family)
LKLKLSCDLPIFVLKLMSSTSEIAGPSADEAIRREMADIISGLANTLGLPRSIGEIYGYLYVSGCARSMEEIRNDLDLSLGTVSQGLRQLKAFKAIRSETQSGDRREYFVAETELRRFVGGFFREVMLPEVERAQGRLDEIAPMVEAARKVDPELTGRFDKMRQWYRNARVWMRPVLLLSRKS